MSERAKQRAAWWGLAIIWGSTYLAIRVAVEHIPPFRVAGVRFLVAGLILSAICAIRGLEWPRTAAAIGRLALIGLLLMVGGNGGVTWAEKELSAGLTALLASTAPLLIGLMALFAPRAERLRARGWAGLALGFAGLAVLLSPAVEGRLSLPHVAAIGLAVICWSFGAHLSRKAGATCDPMAGAAVEMLTGAAVLLALSAAMERGASWSAPWTAWAGVAYLTVFGSCVAFTLFFYLLSHWPAARVATYAYVNPVVAVALGALLLKEPVTARVALGAGLTVLGVFLTNSGRPAASGAVRTLEEDKS